MCRIAAVIKICYYSYTCLNVQCPPILSSPHDVLCPGRACAEISKYDVGTLHISDGGQFVHTLKCPRPFVGFLVLIDVIGFIGALSLLLVFLSTSIHRDDIAQLYLTEFPIIENAINYRK